MISLGKMPELRRKASPGDWWICVAGHVRSGDRAGGESPELARTPENMAYVAACGCMALEDWERLAGLKKAQRILTMAVLSAMCDLTEGMEFAPAIEVTDRVAKELGEALEKARAELEWSE